MTIPTAFTNAAAAVAKSEPELDKLKQAAEGFEAIFLKNMLKTMRGPKQDAAFGGDSAGMSTYRDMMDDALADSSAKGGQLGIAKTLFESGGTLVLRQAMSNPSRRNNPHRS